MSSSSNNNQAASDKPLSGNEEAVDAKPSASSCGNSETDGVQRPMLASQRNWFAKIQAGDDAAIVAYEYPIYSDVQLRGEIFNGLGPYKILNALPLQRDGSVAIAAVLREDLHDDNRWPGALPPATKTNVESYHGGSTPEELAALCSLGLGIRLRAGDANRAFDSRDPRGRFLGYQQSVPMLIFNRERPVIPGAITRPQLDSVQKRLRSIPHINPQLFTELVRSARAYQDALWIAESEPHLAWLLLVSALEIAANARVSHSGSPEENLREYQSKLTKALEAAGGQPLVAAVAEQLKNLFSATKKFMNFCKEFTPPPPEARPSESLQVDWNWANLKKVLETIYAHRSHALHAGIPFPAPMCRPPDEFEGKFSEKGVTSLAESTQGATWLPKDAPMSLNTFQYFVRASLLKWWDHISEQK
ncbi:hypothetical protein [Achromobacter anxifer]|uniref:hypothetical protein n=1 Tax=Achromobacter anxifer TaxID=1287737 RepID=UPI0023F71FB2|nr:hypothetical protein [Achromobacter anxifer]MDF8362389.1 hypothetical protein [Achromobacter anxifer]